jgi:integrase
VARPRILFGLDKRRGKYYGRFHRKGEQSLKLDLISQQDLEFKLTKRGPVARSQAERQALLQELYNETSDRLRTREEVEPNKQKKHNLRHWLQSYIIYLRPLKSAATVRKYSTTLAHFIELYGNLYPHEIKATHFSHFVEYLHHKNLRPRTINSYLVMTGIFLNWLILQKVLTAKPKLPRVAVTRKQPLIYTPEELQDIEEFIRSHIGKRNWEGKVYKLNRRWPMLLRAHYILRFTGVRAGELQFLRWSSIDLQRREITITETPYGHVKGGVERKVYINDSLLAFLLEQEQDCTYYIGNGKGQPYWTDRGAFGKAFFWILKELGIQKPIKPLHGYRATLATELLSDPTNSPVYVQKLLGHKDIATTLIYLNTDRIEVSKILNKVT